VTKLRASDGLTLGTYEVGTRPISADDDGKHIYVTNNNSDTVTKLRESNGVVVAYVQVGDGPFGIAFDGSSLWVANFGSNNVMKLSADGNVDRHLQSRRWSTLGRLQRGRVYVVNNGGDSVTKLSAMMERTWARSPSGAARSGLRSSGSNLWVTNSGGNSVTKR
jgi:YVTN family beta-propeller protein